MPRQIQDHRQCQVRVRYSKREHAKLLADRGAELMRRYKLAEARRKPANKPADAGSEPVSRFARIFKRAKEIVGMVLIVPASIVGVLAGGAAFAMVGIALFALPWVLLARLLGYSTDSGIAIVGVLLVVLIIGALVYTIIGGPRKRAAELVDQCLCGACGYCLEGLEGAEDGRTLCPECGAAWTVKNSENGRDACAVCEIPLAGCEVDEAGLVHCHECGTEYVLTLRVEEPPA